MQSEPSQQPEFKKKAFKCPHCKAFAQMVWDVLLERPTDDLRHDIAEADFYSATCSHCTKPALWYAPPLRIKDAVLPGLSGSLVWPVIQLTAPKPHADLPASCVSDFEEARAVVGVSSRAAAALLRLCVQKLCVDLGGKGENINDDIALLVRKGLPSDIKQALDVVRVVGNNAVHPGEMSNEDTAQVANSLFGLVNFIADRMIAEPRRIQELHDLLPEGAKKAIERRDQQSQTK